MASSPIFSTIADALTPPKIVGKVKALIKPILNFVDSSLGYQDFHLNYDGRPKQDDLVENIVYFYKESGQLYCITKEIADHYQAIENPSEEEKAFFKKGINITQEDIGKEAFENINLSLEDLEKKTQISNQAQSKIYDFLILNNLKSTKPEQEKSKELGYKYAWHKNVALGYDKFKKKFIEKHPRITTIYGLAEKGVGALCTFATSQTGIRIASIASAASVAVATGGILPAALVGAYAAGIGIAIAQQAYSRMKLNKFEEEARLIERYIRNNQDKGITEKFQKSKSSISPPAQEGQIKRFLKASAKHLSTYCFEIALPIATAVLFPTTGALSALQFGAFIGINGLGVGLGAFFRKKYEDQKTALTIEIEQAKTKDNLPHYNNINELKAIIKNQETNLQISNENKPSLEKQSGVRQYWQGLKDVINPFKDSLNIIDARVFNKNIEAAIPLAAAIGIASGNPTIAITAIASSITASTATIGMEAIKSNYTNTQPKNTPLKEDTLDPLLNQKVKERTTKHLFVEPPSRTFQERHQNSIIHSSQQRTRT
jgi:hypothetical protein